MTWAFYGRDQESRRIAEILRRRRWFFARITGRRRIGKTALIQTALRESVSDKVLYVQIPDSAPAGVLSAVADAFETFAISAERFPPPTSLQQLARSVGELARAGYIVALDEFQYFSRKLLAEFTSHLQAVVDDLARDAANVPGGLFVLGSIHTDLVALLEDRDAPLFNRTTDPIELDHLDIASVLEILKAHADDDPRRLLFSWNLFEGVPKFYRDCFEQGVLGADRRALLAKMFFRSSSPLRTEAENWFLSELRGRYDVILKFIARHPGCSHADLVNHVHSMGSESPQQVAGYLKILGKRYRMIERKLPILAREKARSGRYYLRDNFLRSWLGALANPVCAIQFRPEDELVATADERLKVVEVHGLERLVATLYEERSRKGLEGFALSERLNGYWDRGDVELDLVALNDDDEVVRIGTCKRSPPELLSGWSAFERNVERFLEAQPRLRSWRVEKVAIAPILDGNERAAIERRGALAQDLVDLTRGL